MPEHKPTERLVLLGAGGHGRDVLDAARAQGRYIIGFLDDDSNTHGKVVNQVPVMGSIEWLCDHRDVHVISAVGSPTVKQKFAEFLHRYQLQLGLPIVHPQAYVSPDALLGENTVILAGSSIQPQVQVGRHVYISTVCTLGHDVIAEDFVSVHPGVQIGGNVTLGCGSFIGIGATILPGVRVGAWTTVGAGAVVTRDLPDHCTAVGVPAHVIKEHHPR